MRIIYKILIFLLITIIGSNVLWGIKYFVVKGERNLAREQLAKVSENKKILLFQKLFVEEVLKADGVVDFETRVLLQNAVKDIGDEEIVKAWNGFLSSKTEFEGQARVKDLLFLLANKVYQE